MAKGIKTLADNSELRKKANTLFQENLNELTFPKSDEDLLRMVEELKIHQIELEMMYEEVRQSRDDLETSVKLYSELYDFAPIGYFTLNNESKIVNVNLTASKMLKIDRSELLKLSFLQLVTNDYYYGFETFLKKIFYDKMNSNYEVVLKKGNGELVDVRIDTLFDNDTQLCKISLIDITELKTLRKKLEKYNLELKIQVDERTQQFKASEENYRVLAESLEDYVCRIDEEQNIDYINSALLKDLRKEYKDVIGQKLNTILTSFGKRKNNKFIEEVIKNGKSQNLVDKVSWNKWIEWHIVLEKQLIHKTNNIIIVGYDITKRKQIEIKIKDSLAKEKELNNLKMQFVSTVSHEFRTPLTTIYSSVELIERYGAKWDKSKKGNHFLKIKRSIDHLTKMLEEMLLLSRSESSNIKFKPEFINLNKFCISLINDSNSLLSKDHLLKYIIDIPDKNYLIDQSLLQVILTNLISNAIKYSPGGGEISLSVSIKKKKLIFRVKDNGIGISKENLNRIFIPFFRTHETSTITGSGLGLSIAKNYSKHHNGIIEVKSSLGKGSVFTLLLPLVSSNNLP
jgi:PAS domain S-box-containing protein